MSSENGSTDSSPATGVDMENWEELFPFESPYPDQEDAIENIALPAIEAGGFGVVEAACGTGKTLFSLDAAISAVRDPSTPYERVFCVTNVKQQLRAFEDDLEAINANLPDDIDDVSALSMVGKADLCAYTAADELPEDKIYSRCDSLRDPVRDRASKLDGDQQVKQLSEMAGKAEVGGAAAQKKVETDEWTSPYHSGYPTAYSDDSDDGKQYCPFYAKYRAQSARSEKPVFEPKGVVRPWDLMQYAASRGMCPHALLLEGINEAEVVIGNYKHIMDPLTVEAMTGALIGPETILVVDEAHNLVPEAREELSDGVAFSTIDSAIDEIENVILGMDSEPGHIIRGELRNRGFGEETIEELAEVIEDVRNWLSQQVIDELDSINSEWHDDDVDVEIGGDEDDVHEKTLGEKDDNAPDELSEWAKEQGYVEFTDAEQQLRGEFIDDLGVFGELAEFADAAMDAYDKAEDETEFLMNDPSINTVGRVLGLWVEYDYINYFRQLEIEKLEFDRSASPAWRENFKARLELKNCVPREEIADRLEMFGAGILMSATLAPLSVYEETSGLNILADRDREVLRGVYGLSFPEENRESLAVTAKKYTGNNRGSTHPKYRNDSEDAVRESYYESIKATVQTTPGNVLICMPSYSEGEWAGWKLRKDRDVRKDVLIDEPSSAAETEALKREFFGGDAKVMVTGLRGTLTEGVDYDGDRLDAVVVCGVPIRGLGGDYPDAIKHAYEHAFGESNGFDYAFTVPAVRKARQAIGRVIRGADDVGARLYVDERYAGHAHWGNVDDYLPEYEQCDFSAVDSGDVRGRLEAFWSQ